MGPADIVDGFAGDFPARVRLQPLIEALVAEPAPGQSWPCDDGWAALLACYAPADPTVAAVADRIIDGADMPIHVLAAQSGLGERQFRRSFLKATGMPPKRFASVQRVRRACVLSLSEAHWGGIAHDAGYADQPHMNRAMAGAFGASPSAIGRYVGNIRHEFLPGHDRLVQDGAAPAE